MGDPKINHDTIVRSKLDGLALDESSSGMSSMQFKRRLAADEIPIARKAYIEIFGLDNGPTGVELGEEEIILGRNSDCRVTLPLYGVSRYHARIYFFHEEYVIEDMNSTNGTYVNGIKILKCILRNNDQIDIGEAKVIFVEESSRG